MAEARPKCEVSKIHELTGPRGGRLLVLVLTCGGWIIWTARRPPPTAVSCIGCYVRRELARRGEISHG